MKLSALQLVVVLSLIAVVVVTAEDSLHPSNFIGWQDFVVNSSDVRLDRVIVVDQNGSGNSTTVQGAINLVPDGNQARVKISIYPGTYRELVEIPSSKPYISLIGKLNRDGVFPLITYSRKASDKDPTGNQLGSANTATVFIQSNYFVANSLTIENNAIPTGNGGDQAVALRIDGDKAALYKVTILGLQDTLLDYVGTHFFYHCHIQGSVDFIWGLATSLYEDCVLNSTRSGSIAAHGRDGENETGFSFVGCRIQGTGPTILGRAWGKYSRIMYSYCIMDNIIDPAGWSDFNDPTRQNTSYFGEYMNEGPGSIRSGRVPWSKSLDDGEAMRYMTRAFIKGFDWLRI